MFHNHAKKEYVAESYNFGSDEEETVLVGYFGQQIYY